MPNEKFIELEHACGYWIGWVNGVFVAIHQDLETLLDTLKIRLKYMCEQARDMYRSHWVQSKILSRGR